MSSDIRDIRIAVTSQQPGDAKRVIAEAHDGAAVFYRFDENIERAKSEAIAEQAEELEALKAELAHYRECLSHLTPETQLVAAFRVSHPNGYDETARKVIETWKRIRDQL